MNDKSVVIIVLDSPDAIRKYLQVLAKRGH